MTVDILPASGERFSDVTAILAPSRPDTPACWCLTYRLSGSENSALSAAERPERLRELCAGETPPGLVAYVDGVAAGWMSLGRRSDLARLAHSRVIPVIDERDTWSIFCFVVKAAFRGRGLAGQLLAAGFAFAVQHGAEVVEGYPIDPEGGRVGANFTFVGTTGLFESAGFTRIVATSSKSGSRTRWLMRREATP